MYQGHLKFSLLYMCRLRDRDLILSMSLFPYLVLHLHLHSSSLSEHGAKHDRHISDRCSEPLILILKHDSF